MLQPLKQETVKLNGILDQALIKLLIQIIFCKKPPKFQERFMKGYSSVVLD